MGLEVNLSQVLRAVNVICGCCFTCFSSYVREWKDAGIRRVSSDFPCDPVAGTSPSMQGCAFIPWLGGSDSTCLKAKHTHTHTHTQNRSGIVKIQQDLKKMDVC